MGVWTPQSPSGYVGGMATRTYSKGIVVEHLVTGSAEKVSHSVKLKYVVNGTPHTLPVPQRKRIAGIDTVTAAIPVVLVTYAQ